MEKRDLFNGDDRAAISDQIRYSCEEESVLGTGESRLEEIHMLQEQRAIRRREEAEQEIANRQQKIKDEVSNPESYYYSLITRAASALRAFPAFQVYSDGHYEERELWWNAFWGPQANSSWIDSFAALESDVRVAIAHEAFRMAGYHKVRYGWAKNSAEGPYIRRTLRS